MPPPGAFARACETKRTRLRRRRGCGNPPRPPPPRRRRVARAGDGFQITIEIGNGAFLESYALKHSPTFGGCLAGLSVTLHVLKIINHALVVRDAAGFPWRGVVRDVSQQNITN